METVRIEALELSKGLEATASNIERVSKKTSPEAAQWAFGQWACRKNAVAKGFPRAEEMLFTREALEQASHFAVARYHASRFPAGALVADLTCGIGSDLIALAERGPVIGIDKDPERLEYARHNLAIDGLEAQLVHGDCLVLNWAFEYAFADPSRRIQGQVRTLKPELFSPNPSLLAERMAKLKFGLMKLSPMMADDYLLSHGRRVEFISYGGECREALVIFGENGRDGVAAVRADDNATIPRAEAPASVEEPMAYFHEADPAAIRAHALGHIASEHRLLGLGDSNGYLTSGTSVGSPWLAPYKVLGFGRFDTKHLRARLAELGGGKPIVKSRATRVDVVKVRKDLSTKGPGEPIVAIYPVGSSLRYVILERQ